MVRLSCPSCNTAFALPELPADRRATCPRCGDVFPARTFTEDTEPDAAPAAGPPPRPPSRTPLVVAVLALAFLAAGAWIYLTRDRRPDVVPEPARLAGLAYLPADTNLAFGFRPGPVLDHARLTGRESRELLTKAGVPAQALDAVARLGLTLEQIDHLVGGASLGDAEFELRLAIVLVLRDPIPDQAEFLDKIKAARKATGGKERYGVTLGGLPATLVVLSPTVLVLGLDEKKDFEAADRGGYGSDGKQFPPGLAAVLAERVPADAAVWVATDDAAWANKPGVKLLAGVMLRKPEWLPVLARGRAAAAALSLGDQPRLRVFVKAADAETGRKVRDYFAGKAGPKGRSGGEGEVATYDAPIDPEDTFATLEGFLRDAK